jgi:outer membrane protein OmpA-like peptidoglycan-associated protein
MLLRPSLATLAPAILALMGSVLAARAEGARFARSASQGMLADFQSQAGDRVFFAEGSADLGARARAALDAQAAWLLQRPFVAVTIEGYADDWGSSRDNLEIAQRRAQVVRARLILRGVAPVRIATMAFGRTRRAADCASSMCSAQNRRSITVPGFVASGRGLGAVGGALHGAGAY